MNAELDQIKQDIGKALDLLIGIVTIKNVGSSTVTYEWKRVQRGDHIRSKKSDFVQRFFCHYPRSMLKPGESKQFNFSFKSAKVGMFNEEWELLTEPKLQQPLSLVCLNGIATQDDLKQQRRSEFWQQFSQDYPEEQQPSIDELEGFVRNQPETKPDLSDPVILSQVFEDRNKHLGLYYTKQVLDTFYDIVDDCCFVLEREGQAFESEWDVRTESLQKMINCIQNKYSRKDIHDRFVKALSQAKKTPNDRALSFKVIQKAVGNFVGEVVEHDIKQRTAMDLPVPETWQSIPEEWTPEDVENYQKGEAAKMAELLKKTKKKPKTAEED